MSDNDLAVLKRRVDAIEAALVANQLCDASSFAKEQDDEIENEEIRRNFGDTGSAYSEVREDAARSSDSDATGSAETDPATSRF